MLRSRWTVVALVPAVFLTGFALVATLTASDGERRASATASVTGGGAGTESEPAPTATDPDSGPATGTGTGAPGGTGTATEGDDRGADGNGADGDGGVTVDYGAWEGQFEIAGAELVPEPGVATITAELRHLGGECPVGYVEIRAVFYGVDGRQIGTGVWESTSATGAGGEIPQREPLAIEVVAPVDEVIEAATLIITRVDCL